MHATEARHPEKVLDVVLPADDQPTNVMKPSKESFYSRFLGVPERFRCGKQIGSYLGLIPCEESRTKASAVMGPTPRCVISRCTSGRRSASCSIAATELCQGLRGPLHGQQNSKSALFFRKTMELLQVFVSHCPPSVLPAVRMALSLSFHIT